MAVDSVNGVMVLEEKKQVVVPSSKKHSWITNPATTVVVGKWRTLNKRNLEERAKVFLVREIISADESMKIPDKNAIDNKKAIVDWGGIAAADMTTGEVELDTRQPAVGIAAEDTNDGVSVAGTKHSRKENEVLVCRDWVGGIILCGGVEEGDGHSLAVHYPPISCSQRH